MRHFTTACARLFLCLALALCLAGPALASEPPSPPPSLPSSFYGTLGIPGITVDAELLVRVYRDVGGDGAVQPTDPLVASSWATYYGAEGLWTYTLDVPAEPCVEEDDLVFEVSRAPRAVDDAFAVVEDSASNALDVLANDEDRLGVVATATWRSGTNTRVDLDELAAYGLTLAIVSGPADGQASISGTQILYTPSPDYCGPDALTYRITDAEGRSDEAALALTVTCENDPPTDILLSNATVPEREPADTLVGTFTAVDVDGGPTFAYSLVPGTGDTHNTLFAIVDDTLVTAVEFTYTPDNAYTIRVQVDDGNGGTFERSFVITVLAVNRDPTDIDLANTSVPENQPIGTVVGTLTTTDPDSDPTFTYTLVAGEGSSGNSAFQITGDELETKAVFDYEAQSSYAIRIRTEDGRGGSFEKAFTISVVDVNEAPVVASIPNQTIAQDEVFGTITLDDYVTDEDLGDSPADMDWSIEGADALEVIIEDRIATVSSPAGWHGTETITFTATDPGGLSGSVEVTFRTLARQTIALVPGWNLAGLSISPVDPAIDVVLASIASDVSLVYAWDAALPAGSAWRLYDARASLPVGELTTLAVGQGFWVHVTAESPLNLVVDGIAEGITTMALATAAGGYNLVAWPSNAPVPLPGALTENGVTAFDLVYAYHADDVSDPWKLYQVGAPAWANDLGALAAGRGYWVNVSEDAIWSVEYHD